MELAYQPIGRSLLTEADDQQLFQNVAHHYLAQAQNDFEMLDLVAAPPEARLIWILWMFFAEVASSGLNVYLWNHCYRFSELREAYDSIEKIGASEVLELLKGAVAFAHRESLSEFLNDQGAPEWASQFQVPVGWSPREIDHVSMEAVERASREVAQYIRNNSDKL